MTENGGTPEGGESPPETIELTAQELETLIDRRVEERLAELVEGPQTEPENKPKVSKRALLHALGGGAVTYGLLSVASPGSAQGTTGGLVSSLSSDSSSDFAVPDLTAQTITVDTFVDGVVGSGFAATSLVDAVDGFRASGGASLQAGDAGNVTTLEVADGKTVEVLVATLILSDGQPAPDNLDLDFATLSGDGSGRYRGGILTGDGATHYVEEANSDPMNNPLASYTNTSGSSQMVAIVVNNGMFNQTGTGSAQDTMAYVLGRVV